MCTSDVSVPIISFDNAPGNALLDFAVEELQQDLVHHGWLDIRHMGFPTSPLGRSFFCESEDAPALAFLWEIRRW